VGLHALTYVQLTLIFIALPAYAASTISGERERETLEMLRATLLSPWDVVTGKLLSVLAFGAILLGTTVPIAAWCLLLGGVSPTEVFRVYMLLLVTAWWVSSLGVLMSTHFSRAIGAIVATYGAILGTGVLAALLIYAGFAWMTIATHGRSMAIGLVPAALVVAVPVEMTATVATVLAWWLIGRIPRVKRVTQYRLLAVVLQLAVFGLLMWTALPLVQKLGHAAPMSLLLVNPYAGAAATLEDAAGRELIQSSMTPGITTPATDLPGYIWSVLMWIYAVVALGLWMLAVHHYERHAVE